MKEKPSASNRFYKTYIPMDASLTLFLPYFQNRTTLVADRCILYCLNLIT